MKKYDNFFGVMASLLLLLSINACSNSPSQVSEPVIAAEPVANQGGKDWPAEISKVVPVFKAGRLDEINSNIAADNNTWVLKFRNTTSEDVVAYREVLSQQSFKPTSMPLNNNSTMIVGQKEDFTVTINFKDGLTTVGVNLKK